MIPEAKSESEKASLSTFPLDSIDPAKKDGTWGLAWAKAAYYNFQYFVPRTCFYNSADKYEELRLYALGQVPINKFKKMFGVDEQTNLSWLNINWTPPHAIGTIRDIAISRMCQQEYDIVATPIDPMAKSDADALYAALRARVAIREQAQKTNPQLAQHPMVQARPGEPMDEEELNMRLEFGEQFNRSKDAEQAIKLGMYENNEHNLRRGWYEDFFDVGVSGYIEWLDKTTNKPKAEKINPESFITSYSRFNDFRDLRYAGPIVDMDITDLAMIRNKDGEPTFTDQQLEMMASDVAGRWGNPQILGRSSYYFKGFDRFKVKVLKLRWKSYNDYYYNEWRDKTDNPQFEFKNYSTAQNSKRKYPSKRVEVAYEISWVVGTDYYFDFGLMENQSRSADPTKKGAVSLGIKLFAPNFYEMRAEAMMERLLPIMDQYLMNWYRIQNLKNRMIPSGWWIDLDALESAALTKGGKKMTALELLDMFFQTGVLVGRSKDIMGDTNVNYKPVIPIQNSMFQDLVALFQDMGGQLMSMKQTVGLNDVTDATTPPERMLVPGIESANQGTNNALYPMQFGEKHLYQQLANDIMIRTQQGLQKGGVSGWGPSLGSNTLKFIEVDKGLALRNFGIMLEEKPSDDQRMFLIQQFQPDLMNGTLDVSDCIVVMNTYNTKQAAMYLSWKVKKNKQQVQQNAMMNSQQQIQGSQQTVQMTQQFEIQLQQLKDQAAQSKAEMMKEMDVRIAQIKADAMESKGHLDNLAKVSVQQLANQAKAQPETAPMTP
jgi:hypothetical protein